MKKSNTFTNRKMSKLQKQDQGFVFRFNLYTGHTSKYDLD